MSFCRARSHNRNMQNHKNSQWMITTTKLSRNNIIPFEVDCWQYISISIFSFHFATIAPSPLLMCCGIAFEIELKCSCENDFDALINTNTHPHMHILIDICNMHEGWSVAKDNNPLLYAKVKNRKAKTLKTNKSNCLLSISAKVKRPPTHCVLSVYYRVLRTQPFIQEWKQEWMQKWAKTKKRKKRSTLIFGTFPFAINFRFFFSRCSPFISL